MDSIEFFLSVMVETVASVVGVFVGALGAIAIDRANTRRQLRNRAQQVLHAIETEMRDNLNTLETVREAYAQTEWGKSFYVSTVAWETALAHGDLPEILGYDMTDALTEQYAQLARLRYYVGLMTQLWFAPREIDGYDAIRSGFRATINDTLQAVTHGHQALVARIVREQRR